MTQAAPTVLRSCRGCSRPLVRRAGEGFAAFARRVHCDQSCARRAQRALPPREGLPSAPLAAFIDRLARRLAGRDSVTARNEACARAGVSVRKVADWRDGRVREVSPERADEILVRLGALWWDVFDEESVRRPLLSVAVFVWIDGRRVLDRVVTYGDDGPDWRRLERIRREWEGEPLPERCYGRVVRLVEAECAPGATT